LDHTHGTIECASISPSLKVVRFRHMPGTVFGCLIEVRTNLDRITNLFQLGSEIKIVGRGVDRIDPKHNQSIDLAALHIRAEIAQRLKVIHRMLFNGLDVIQSCPDIAKRRIDGMGKRVDCGRLVFSGNHKRRTLMLLEVFRDNFQPLFGSRRKTRGCVNAELSSKCSGKQFDFRGASRQTMIGAGACHARRWLNHVQAIHRVARARQLAATREFSSVTDVCWSAAEKIGVERNDHVGLFEAINGADVGSKGELSAFARPVACGRLPLVPFGLRIERQKRLNLRRQRRRRNNSGQDPKACAFCALEGCSQGLRTIQK